MTMYIDLTLIFLIYAFSCIALGISLYALLTLKELEEWYRSKVKKSTSAWDYYHDPKNQKKSKSHWK